MCGIGHCWLAMITHANTHSHGTGVQHGPYQYCCALTASRGRLKKILTSVGWGGGSLYFNQVPKEFTVQNGTHVFGDKL